MPFASYVMQATCFFTIGFFVFGPQMLIGMAAAECSHKEAAGAATGFVGLFAYLGASLAGWYWRKYSIPGTGADFCGYLYRRRDFRTAVTALLNAQTPREA